MKNRFTEEDAAILRALGQDGADMEPEQNHREEHMVAGFLEIQQFAERTGGLPQPQEGRDIQERIFAVRLDCIRGLDDAHSVLGPLDQAKIIKRTSPNKSAADELTDDQIVEMLSTEESDNDIFVLRNVRSSEDREAADEIATRKPCKDFTSFRRKFEKVRSDLKSGIRKSRRFEKKAEIEEGRFFILGGQIAYVDSVGETIHTKHRRNDARLRVIFDNGTENNMLLRSLQKALLKDDAGRRISEPKPGPVLGNWKEEGEVPHATVYVLRSNSKDPEVAALRNRLHKIGVTTTDIRRRLSGAHLQPTYLMASVEWVTEYQLFNVDHKQIEKVIHKALSHVRFNKPIEDRFGNLVKPREWFIVPDFVIQEVVNRIRDRSITDYYYDPKSESLVKWKDKPAED